MREKCEEEIRTSIFPSGNTNKEGGEGGGREKQVIYIDSEEMTTGHFIFSQCFSGRDLFLD
jgi:hypothetical protein